MRRTLVHRFTQAVLGSVLLALAVTRAAAFEERVQAWEDTLVIPTYVVGPAEPNPIFYLGRAYQGAKGPVYPYPLLDRLSDIKVDKTYKAFYLENAYIRLCVLPEIGGRIFEALDKTNAYHFVYRQHVIKPALIGMLGAWISGGVEWNIPHHHRATTFMPVDASIIREADGRATLWIGEIELRHRTKWLVGLTLRPDSSAIEVTTRVFNRTSLPHSILCFANIAVHANENYQIIFPPSTEIATFHGKNQFSHWPVSYEVFNRQNYADGVDVSWWKNHLTPTSFFAFDMEEDFFAGYDHGKEAGLAFIGDHHSVPGKKLWTWGTGSEGQTWERILTDDDGPYLELMVGSYSDNQPDYSWTQPYETKDVTQHWYPLRGLGKLGNANREGAVGLDVSSEDGTVRLAFNTTKVHDRVKAVLKAGNRLFFEDHFAIGPARPYSRRVELPKGIDDRELRVFLFTEEGDEIVRYTPPRRKDKSLPPPVIPPPPPEEIDTNEELYLAGLRLEQFHNPSLEPYPYYEEALRRDSGDSRANTALAVLFLKRGMYREAELRLNAAIGRLTHNYTRPLEGGPYYFLGLALRNQGKRKEATDAFQRAAWSAAWQAAAYYQLAEMAAEEGGFAKASDFAERSLSVNRRNTKALNLNAALLRGAGKTGEAFEVAKAARLLDPLDSWALHEVMRGKRNERNHSVDDPAGEADDIFFRGNAAVNMLELALDYGNVGFWEEAVAVLRGDLRQAEKMPENPLLHYLLAFGLERLGDDEAVSDELKKAAALSPEYVFPFALEMGDILEWAGKKNPSDSRAPYYLGNLMFDHQPERAIAMWEASRALDSSYSVVHRNLGLAYSRIRGDIPSAIESLEKALRANPRDPRLYYEIDVLYEAAGIDPSRRLSLLEKNHDIVARHDDALTREIALLIQVGRTTRAIDLLRGHHFHVWEGGGAIHGLWIESHLLRGRNFLEAGEHRKALEDFELALTYPENLEVGPPSRGVGSAKIFYFIGLAHALLGEDDEALSFFRRAADFRSGELSEQYYYRCLALEKTDRKEEALGRLHGLVISAEKAAKDVLRVDFFKKFGEKQSSIRRKARYHYLSGLGYLGLGLDEKAASAFREALDMDGTLYEARLHLEKLRKLP